MKIAAVLVTYNRLPLLQQAVACVLQQTRPPEAIYLIDNSSTDGTEDWAKSQPQLIYIRQPNSGGAGGFFTGLKLACEAGYDWVWAMDDDSLPEPGALAALTESTPFQDPKTGYLASLVLWKDNTPHKMNLAEYRKDGVTHDSGVVPIVVSSFVSFLVSSPCIRQIGLPYREMVIWCDDTEYTSRITRSFNAYEIRNSRVLHATADNSSPDFRPLIGKNSPKLRYGLRNRTFVQLKRQTKIKSKIRLLGLFLKEAWLMGREHSSARVLGELIYWTLSGLWFQPSLEFTQNSAGHPK